MGIRINGDNETDGTKMRTTSTSEALVTFFRDDCIFFMIPTLRIESTFISSFDYIGV